MGIAVYLSDTCNSICLVIHQNISKVRDRELNIKDSKEEILFDHKLSNHKPLASNKYGRQEANSEILNFVKILAFCVSR